jgi:hypothetical protein
MSCPGEECSICGGEGWLDDVDLPCTGAIYDTSDNRLCVLETQLNRLLEENCFHTNRADIMSRDMKSLEKENLGLKFEADRLRLRVSELQGALQELYDWQNGPPLLSPKWLRGWGDAMDGAEKVMESTEVDTDAPKSQSQN